MVLVVVLAVIFSQLAWIDPLFIPLVLLGPIVTGIVFAVQARRARDAALTWGLAGLLMLISDFVVNHEDVGFHAGIAVVTAAIAAGACAGVGAMRKRRRVPA